MPELHVEFVGVYTPRVITEQVIAIAFSAKSRHLLVFHGKPGERLDPHEVPASQGAFSWQFNIPAVKDGSFVWYPKGAEAAAVVLTSSGRRMKYNHRSADLYEFKDGRVTLLHVDFVGIDRSNRVLVILCDNKKVEKAVLYGGIGTPLTRYDVATKDYRFSDSRMLTGHGISVERRRGRSKDFSEHEVFFDKEDCGRVLTPIEANGYKLTEGLVKLTIK